MDIGGTCLLHVLQRRNGARLHNIAMKKMFWGQTQGFPKVDVDISFGVKRLQNGPFLFHKGSRQEMKMLKKQWDFLVVDFIF